MTIDEAIKSLEPSDDGWFKDGTEESVADAVRSLVENGFTPEAAADLVEGIISAIRNEYGD